MKLKESFATNTKKNNSVHQLLSNDKGILAISLYNYYIPSNNLLFCVYEVIMMKPKV